MELGKSDPDRESWQRHRKRMWATECIGKEVARCLGPGEEAAEVIVEVIAEVMSVEARELTDERLVWEGARGAEELGIWGSQVEEEEIGAAMGKIPSIMI